MSGGPFPGGSTGDGGYLLFTSSTLERIARRLDSAGTDLEGQAARAPDAPDVGVCTAAVASTLALFAESLGGIVTACGVAADTVVRNQQLYAKAEDASIVTITQDGCRLVDGGS